MKTLSHSIFILLNELLGYPFLVWLRNWIIPAGLDLVLSHAEKSCTATYYRQFFTNIKMKRIKLIPVLLVKALGPSGQTKLVLILITILLFDAIILVLF